MTVRPRVRRPQGVPLRLAQAPRRLAMLALVAVLASGCVGTLETPPSWIDSTRLAAQGSDDPAVLGRWLLGELLAPGGDAKRMRLARLRLDELGVQGGPAALARAVDYDLHGRFREASDSYLRLLAGARDDQAAEAPLVAWMAANRLVSLAPAVPALWPKARALVESLIARPGWTGWRARGELVEWWSRERLRGVQGPVDERVFDEIADRHGCVRQASLAGPFGQAPRSDHRVHFEAEKPAPWPSRFEPVRRRLEQPRVWELEHHGCLLRPTASTIPAGIFYVQTFVELPRPRDVVLAVQGAAAIFVDDREVLTRDTAVWGVWPRFGVQLHLGKGRHRILARLGTPETSVRILTPDGIPLGLAGSADDHLPYELAPPTLLSDPNVLEPFLRDAGVPPQPGVPAPPRAPDLHDPTIRYVAAYLAHIEAQDDVASVLLEPLVRSRDEATAAALAQQAVFVDGDPIFSPDVGLDLAKDLRERAAELDPDLWGPRVWLALEQASKSQPHDRVGMLEEVVRQFPEVPPLAKRLASLYAELGWAAEHTKAVEQAAARFPEDVDVLKALLEVELRRGNQAAADRLSRRIRELAPADEVELRRAVARQDWQAAIRELERIGTVRPNREDIALRLDDLRVRAGEQHETLEQLGRALAKDPQSAGARLALADARLAAGERSALTDALADALRTGADTSKLRTAVELTEGTTDLAPYRRDGLALIREAERSGVQLPGTSARLLDYVALWVEPDGSARMLEHELIRVQSREGIEQHLEQTVPRGIVLKVRTVKRDGTVHEPEVVAGKPTVTMPHLEVGDYIETESIWLLKGDGQGGRAFLSPRWMFQEKNVSYHQSEFVVISPLGRALQIETTGTVPAPTVEQSGALVVRRWRVDQSVGVPDEPFAAPAEEYLPSVRVGWGIELGERLRRLADNHRDETPRDPRLVRLAKSIVAAEIAPREGATEPLVPAGLSIDEKARRIYRWVLDNVQPGEENAPPRILTAKAGDRLQAFVHLCRLAGLDARIGVIEDRLLPPPVGPFGEATKHTAAAVRLQTDHGPRWLVVGERYAPYGYLPSSLRGQPAVLLDTLTPVVTPEPPPLVRETTSAGGALDRIAHVGKAKVAADGSAVLELEQRYHGKYAIIIRSRLAQVQEARWRDVLEAEVLGLALPGARISDLKVGKLADLDEPVVLTMRVELPSFARRGEGSLDVDVPFLPRLGPLAQLAERQTPLYLPERVATSASVELDVELPPGASVASELEPATLSDGSRTITVADKLDRGRLRISRSLDVPAGRVQPEEYPAFRAFAQGADAGLHRTVRITLGP